jgi:hypothetical protein
MASRPDNLGRGTVRDVGEGGLGRWAPAVRVYGRELGSAAGSVTVLVDTVISAVTLGLSAVVWWRFGLGWAVATFLAGLLVISVVAGLRLGRKSANMAAQLEPAPPPFVLSVSASGSVERGPGSPAAAAVSLKVRSNQLADTRLRVDVVDAVDWLFGGLAATTPWVVATERPSTEPGVFTVHPGRDVSIDLAHLTADVYRQPEAAITVTFPTTEGDKVVTRPAVGVLAAIPPLAAVNPGATITKGQLSVVVRDIDRGTNHVIAVEVALYVPRHATAMSPPEWRASEVATFM